MPMQLSILTPQGSVFEGNVDSVLIPGAEGDFGVLPEHERFLTPIRIGELAIQSGGKTTYAAVAEGFADVSAQAVAVLAEACELASSIDAARAELAVQRGEQGLAALSRDAEAARIREYEVAIERARNRLAVRRRGAA
jgi:F-type H+-transporting ATPase subunit epsilon